MEFRAKDVEICSSGRKIQNSDSIHFHFFGAYFLAFATFILLCCVLLDGDVSSEFAF